MIEAPKMGKDLACATIPAVVEPKIDGEFVVWDGTKLINRYGRERYLPFCDGLPKDVKIMGELYLPSGKRNFYEAQSYLKNNSEKLNFMSYGMYDSDLPYHKQIQELICLLALKDQVQVIEGRTAYSHADIKEYCNTFYKEGWEGAVIKSKEGSVIDRWIKFKPDDAILLDLRITAIRKDKYAIAVGTKEGEIIGHCSLYGHDDVFKKIKDMKIVGRDSKHYFIPAEVIVEVKHLGLINGKSLRSPRIARMREDISG